MTSSDNTVHFWIFIATGICFHAAGLTLVRCVVYLCDSEFIALCGMALIVFVLVNMCGFTIARKDINDVFIWMYNNIIIRYYTNPFTYAIKILSTNEFLSSDDKYKNGVGLAALKELDFPTSKDDMYLWFIALIMMHIVCIFINIFRC